MATIPELDINVIAVEFINSKIDGFFGAGKRALRLANDKILLKLRSTYSDYLRTVWNRHACSKSFFFKNEAKPIYEFYVPMGLNLGEKVFEENASILGITQRSKSVVITGAAGIGKSIMVKHLLVDSLIKKYKVPILVELRRINQESGSITDLIIKVLHENSFELDSDFIFKALEDGHFVLFLDGYDEIDFSKRKVVAEDIKALSLKYPGNTFIISSRPDHEFSGWASFLVLGVSPLTKEQACNLVGRLPYDEEIKGKFLRDLSESLYEKHISFLSNPLLLSIMLLTYGQSADIPSKVSIFYNQAYEALFQQHDAVKGAYQRKRHCHLDILDFAKIFAAFSIQTYDRRIFQVSESDALTFLNKAKEICQIEFGSKDYLKDAIQSVCLLVQDGLLVAFTHRSFQEYFSARFINDQKPEIAKKLMNKFSKDIRSDNIFKLLYDLNPSFIEREFIIPKIDELLGILQYKTKIGVRQHLKFLRICFKTIEIERHSHHDGKKGIIGTVKSTYWLDFAHFVFATCGQYSGWNGYNRSDEENNNLELFYDKYLEDKEERLFDTSKLKIDSEFYSDLIVHNTIFSMSLLNSLIIIKKRLVEKNRESEESLQNILLKKG